MWRRATSSGTSHGVADLAGQPALWSRRFAVRSESMDPNLPVYDVASMNELLDRSLASRRFSAQLVGGFAGVSLLLASIGIYGVLAYMVSQRSREIGLRMALGAKRADILKLVVTRGVVLSMAGIAAGVMLCRMHRLTDGESALRRSSPRSGCVSGRARAFVCRVAVLPVTFLRGARRKWIRCAPFERHE